MGDARRMTMGDGGSVYCISSQVDQSGMTGESLPVKFRPGDLCKMGSTVKSGEVRAP